MVDLASNSIPMNESEHRIAKRNVLLLACAQATGFAVAPISMAIGGLAGHYLLGDDKTFATLPITAYVLGPLLGSMPAALLMKQVGRRFGFMAGAALGIFGCVVATYAIVEGSFALFCLAMMMNGISLSFAQQYRFAAADTGTAEFRTKAISWVMAGGLVAAVVGPQTALLFGDLLAPVQFAGSFVGGAILSAIGFAILFFLKDTDRTSETADATPTRPARPLKVIAKQPVFITSVICGACSYMMMSLVMTAAPLAMVLCGYSTDVSTLGIQWHVMAMFAPSFFTGHLIVKFGHGKLIGAGLLLFLICGAIGIAGIEIANFWAALIALGFAWNFGYIGATSLVTKAYEPHEKNKVQGLFDSLVFALVAVISLMSGVIMSTFGWAFVLALIIPFVLIAGIALLRPQSGLKTAGAA